MSLKSNRLPIIFCVLIFLGMFWLAGCKKGAEGSGSVVPQSPTNLNALVVSTTQVNLSWTDNATNETGYKVQRKTLGGNFTDIGATGKGITVYSDLGLTPYTTYIYRVYAYNSAGPSLSYSNEDTVLTALLASLTTTPISDTTETTALSGGNITSDAGKAITARGVVWNSQTNPVVTLPTKTIDSSGTGSFSSLISGLTPNTTEMATTALYMELLYQMTGLGIRILLTFL